MKNICDIDRAGIVSARHYIIATDGSCTVNPGPGGWALVKQLWLGTDLIQQAANAGGPNSLTETNNRMELMAAIMAVEGVRELSTPVIIQTDSNYVLQGATTYLPKWKANGWKSSSGRVKNRELWMRLDDACIGKTIYWEKVAGHSGHVLNELTDVLAKSAAEGKFPSGQASVRKQHPKLFKSTA